MVTVPVDDAVTGDLPPLCIYSGRPAEMRTRIVVPVGGGGDGWQVVLVLLGPVGWIVLALLAVRGRSSGAERLTVRLPITRERSTWARRLRLSLTVMQVLVLVLALGAWAIDGWGHELGAAAVVALFGALGFRLQEYFRLVGVELDATRRWVHLQNVHPDFVAAVAAQHPRRSPTSGGRPSVE